MFPSRQIGDARSPSGALIVRAEEPLVLHFRIVSTGSVLCSETELEGYGWFESDLCGNKQTLSVHASLSWRPRVGETDAAQTSVLLLCKSSKVGQLQPRRHKGRKYRQGSAAFQTATPGQMVNPCAKRCCAQGRATAANRLEVDVSPIRKESADIVQGCRVDHSF